MVSANVMIEYFCLMRGMQRRSGSRKRDTNVRPKRDHVVPKDLGLTRLTRDEIRKIIGIEYLGNVSASTIEYLSDSADDVQDNVAYKRHCLERDILAKTKYGEFRETNAYVILDETERSPVGATLICDCNLALYRMKEGSYREVPKKG
ncbi:hypothetical protein K8R33_04565 [archaeon]|nr:hypothetical protein [archaeon]